MITLLSLYTQQSLLLSVIVKIHATKGFSMIPHSTKPRPGIATPNSIVEREIDFRLHNGVCRYCALHKATDTLYKERELIEGDGTLRKFWIVRYELLLKRGVDLAVPIENREMAGKTVSSISYGVLFACLDESINKDQVEEIGQGIVEWHRELAPSSDTHVFFRDSAFSDDVSKTNMAAILEQNGINHVRSL